MRRLVSAGLLILLILAAIPASATTSFGGRGLLYVQSARPLKPGHLEFFTGARYFGKIVSGGPYTFWDVKIVTSFNVGISNHLEFAVTPILYQDTNRGEENNLPDDIFVSVKLGNFGGRESNIIFGGFLYTRLPTAKRHNIIYEPYSAGWEGGRLEVGIKALFSYFKNAIFPDDGWSIHANLGYHNHNDVGKANTGNELDPQATAMSSALLAGVGFNYPFDTFEFSVELNGRIFLQYPPVTAYSRENDMYLTAGIRYTPYRWVTFHAGMDILLYVGDDETDYINTALPGPPDETFPNYPHWRGLLGAKFVILPISVYKSTEKERLERQATERTDTLERMIKDQKDTSDAENELIRLRSERKRVEEELKRIRKLLEEEKKKK